MTVVRRQKPTATATRLPGRGTRGAYRIIVVVHAFAEDLRGRRRRRRRQGGIASEYEKKI